VKQLIQIGNRKIGSGLPVYIIAEMSANHNQDFDKAVDVIKAAADTGADAVKIQTYTPDTLTINSKNKHFEIEGTIWEGRYLYDLYKEAYMPWEWQPKLQKIALDLGLDFFSTAYDPSSVDFLLGLDIPIFKVASFEVVDLPLLRLIAQTGKPIILSTGMATLAEIEEAVDTIKEAGGEEIALLKCTSAYPAPAEEMNLRTIPDLIDRFGSPVGLSDHTMGIAVPVAAVTLGACIIEKHFTLSRDLPGPDSSFSLQPEEFKMMVNAIRTAEKALGDINYEVNVRESSSHVFRRSLFVVKDMKAGEEFSHENVRSIRPGYGLHTKYIDEIIGQVASGNINKGIPLSWDLVEKKE
jgi:pseudaminic acid synthase